MAIADTPRTGADPDRPERRERVLRADAWRTTRFSDVCGGTDEFKRYVVEETAAMGTAGGRAVARALVDDGLYMLARMEERLREYQAFREALAGLVEQMQAIAEPRLGDAAREAAELRRVLDDSGELPAHDELIRRVEEIRQVANDMEGALRRHKEAALAAGKAYVALRGSRGWDDGIAALASTEPAAGGASAGTEEAVPTTNGVAAPVPLGALPPGVPEAWLPPSPHREQIVDWLRRGRAALLSAAESARLPVGPQGREPWVQFEDGGVMPLRVVRWNEEIRNFHPLGQDPHPRGRLYRGKRAPVPPPPSGT